MSGRVRRGPALSDGVWLVAAILAGGAAALAADKPVAATRPATTAPTTTAAAATRPVDPDLVGWWRADATAADEVTDLSGRGHPAKPFLRKVVVETVKGRAGLRVTNASRELDAGADRAFDFTADFTVALWVKLAEDASDVIILSKRGERGADGWAIVHGIQGHGGIGFVAAPRVVVPTPCKAVNDWAHVTVTFHRKDFLLYVDGKAIGVMELPTVPAASAQPLLIGAGADGRRGIDGWIDDIRIYHRALTADDVEALAAGKEPASPYVKLAPAEEKQARAWIDDLGAESYGRREKAVEHLRAMGRKAFPLLREFRDSEDPEVALRVKGLLGELPRGDGAQP
jgi:hypothetical protein